MTVRTVMLANMAVRSTIQSSIRLCVFLIAASIHDACHCS